MEHPRAKLIGSLPIVIDAKMREESSGNMNGELSEMATGSLPPPSYEESAFQHKWIFGPLIPHSHNV